jgi:anhydro-N-acetylmuramic acid kinase
MAADSPPLLCIGLMSGTSLDAVDGCLLAMTDSARMQGTDAATPMRQLAFASRSMPPALRAELLALNTPGDNELHRAALAANALMDLYAEVTEALCTQAAVQPIQIAVIGAHGQTVRHRPQMFDGTGYTLQLVNGALLAERTGIAVACDFRSRDVAAGGQGAPLVPAFHAALWGAEATGLAVLNLGGMANLTLLQPGRNVVGFDCGPANVLLDHWCVRHTGQPYDAGGAWAAQGTVHASLLQQLLADPYIGQEPPKSTGRDHFCDEWLQRQLHAHTALPPADVQATLTAFTVQAATLHLRRHAPAVHRLLVCGGGVRNTHLMQGLAAALPEVAVTSTSQFGIDPQAVEAAAFAWLASKTLRREPVDWRSVTGTGAAHVPGCLYAAAY